MKASWYSQRSKAPHSSDAFKVSLVKKKKKHLTVKIAMSYMSCWKPHGRKNRLNEGKGWENKPIKWFI
jgi:hypothetical protein